MPVYWLLYRTFGAAGLAVASDIGILIQTTVLAVLLHRRRMVSMAGLNYGEIGRSVLAGVVALAALLVLRHFAQTTSRLWELGLLVVAMGVWIGVSLVVLRLTGSALPGQLRARFARRA